MPTIACYTRVSTADQSLDRQLDSTRSYAQREFDAGLDDLAIYRDKSTGTDTDRSGYQEMMDDVNAGDLDAVVVHSISRISRSIRDLDRTVERIVEDNGVEFHIVSEGLRISDDEADPFQRATLRLLGVFAQLEAEMNQMRTKEGIAARMTEEEYHHGRPPLGFRKENGRLIEAENYDDVVARLDMVQKDNLSKRQAAKELDTSRRTINRALERKEVYGL